MSIQTISSQKQTKKTLDFRQKYKTEMCRYWYERGFCPFNKFCAFAHNEDEMREKNTFNFKYRTKLCHNFFEYGFCKYGDRCQYIHNKNLRLVKQGDKTRSNSEESYSSKSSSQQKSNQSLTQQKQHDFKHQAQYNMLKEDNYELFGIMMIRSQWMEQLIEGDNVNILITNDNQSTCYEGEYYQGLGSREQKKFRMYSM